MAASTQTLRIRAIRSIPLFGESPKGGWSAEIKPEDTIHALIAVHTDGGPIGYGSVFTDARLVAAPDDQGRDLIAVFTHADAFDAFAEETNDEELRSVTLSGVELCEQLRELGVDGVMFDCSGPGPVSVFERAFAEDVLRTA